MASPEIFLPRMKWFYEQMEGKMLLPKNIAKGDWRESRIRDLYVLLIGEVRELEAELYSSGPHDNIVKECADIANFAMMIADRVNSG